MSFPSSNDSPALIYSLWWLAFCRLIDSKPSSSYLHFSSPPPPNHFSFHIKFFFFPLPLLCHWILFDRKYSRRCGVVVDLRPWQTVSIGLICIHKSIGYLTLANILGSREWRCWVGQVTLSLVMELWWSVTAPHSCWLTGWDDALLKMMRKFNRSLWLFRVIHTCQHIYIYMYTYVYIYFWWHHNDRKVCFLRQLTNKVC